MIFYEDDKAPRIKYHFSNGRRETKMFFFCRYALIFSFSKSDTLVVYRRYIKYQPIYLFSQKVAAPFYTLSTLILIANNKVQNKQDCKEQENEQKMLPFLFPQQSDEFSDKRVREEIELCFFR